MVIEDLEHVLAPRKLLDLVKLTPPPHNSITPYNPLSKSNESFALTHPETGYKRCKFCENRARDTPLRGVYIPNFDQISVKLSVLGSYTLIIAPMGVKFGTEEGTRAKFHPIGATCRPCKAKNLKIGL